MIINVLAAALMVVMFAVLLHLIGVVARTKEVLSIGRRAGTTIRDTSLSDTDKERQMQQSSLKLFRLLGWLIIGTAFALVVPFILVWLAALAGVLTLAGVMDMFLRWDFIIGSTVLGIAAYVAAVKWLR